LKTVIEMTTEEYEAFLQKCFPEVYKLYAHLLDDMTNKYFYDERTIKAMLLTDIVPLINEKLDDIRKLKEKESKS